VKLNTDSLVEVSYNSHKRNLHLHRGEAFFLVARDADRPFVVNAGGKSVQALGTAFAVRLDSANLQVTVTEGRVKLGRDPEAPRALDGSLARSKSERDEDRPRLGKGERSPVVLEAGQRLLVADQSLHIDALSVEQINRKLSWRDRLLDFSETPLEDVVSEVNRYTTSRIEIVDPGLRQLKFGGVFPTSDTGSLLNALETAYGIDVQHVENGQVLLSWSSRR